MKEKDIKDVVKNATSIDGNSVLSFLNELQPIVGVKHETWTPDKKIDENND